ncbi:unnamed protein product, partial [Closterium sp. NIES-54]
MCSYSLFLSPFSHFLPFPTFSPFPLSPPSLHPAASPQSHIFPSFPPPPPLRFRVQAVEDRLSVHSGRRGGTAIGHPGRVEGAAVRHALIGSFGILTHPFFPLALFNPPVSPPTRPNHTPPQAVEDQLSGIQDVWKEPRFDTLPHVVAVLTSGYPQDDMASLAKLRDTIEVLVDDVVQAYHQGFNKAIHNYSQVLVDDGVQAYHQGFNKAIHNYSQVGCSLFVCVRTDERAGGDSGGEAAMAILSAHMTIADERAEGESGREAVTAIHTHDHACTMHRPCLLPSLPLSSSLQILKLFSESAEQMSELKASLAEARRLLSNRHKQLQQLWCRSITLRHVISLIDQIDSVSKARAFNGCPCGASLAID